MKQPYKDITNKLGEPLWWDKVGVPRYEPFEPSLCNDVYANEAVLLEIACQYCGHHFKVAISRSNQSQIDWPGTLAERVQIGSIAYLDPPNWGCCDAGPTMTSNALEVLEFWVRLKSSWLRVPELEGPLPE